MSDESPTPAPDLEPPEAQPPALPVVADAESEARLALACRSLDDPLSPALRRRCPRCGEHLRKPLGDDEARADACVRCGVAVRSAEAGRFLLEARSAPRELLRGIAYLPRGALKLIRTPRLWPYATIPLLLNILALVVAGVVAYTLVRPWLNGVIESWEQAGGAWAILRWGLVFLEYVGFLLVFPAIAFLIVCPVFNIPYKLVFMPFMEILTEATEREVLEFEDTTPFSLGRVVANASVAVVDAILLTLLQGLALVLLLPLNFVPFVGSVTWAVVPPALFASMDYTDINLVRRGYTTREKMRLWWVYQWRFFGYGLAFFLFITVPVLNAFVIPAAAVGGALLYLELERK